MYWDYICNTVNFKLITEMFTDLQQWQFLDILILESCTREITTLFPFPKVFMYYLEVVLYADGET